MRSIWDTVSDLEWSQVTLAYPWVLLLLLAIPYLYYLMRQSRDRSTSVRLSTLRDIQAPRTWRIRLVGVLPFLRLVSLALLIGAMARPQIINSYNYSPSMGYNIMICLDVSWSMMSKDFSPDRLTVAKDITEKFVYSRKGDKIGLIDFSTEAILRAPLTTDRQTVIDELKKSESSLEYSATAIGDAIGLAVDRIKDIPAESKIIVLLTDGEETSGYMTAETALEIAEVFGVKIYTIGIGGKGSAMMPVPQANGQLVDMPQPVNMDEELLQNMADQTGGKFYRADDKQVLTNIYKDINSLEKSQLQSRENTQKRDVFMIFVFISIIFILSEWVLRYLVLRPKT